MNKLNNFTNILQRATLGCAIGFVTFATTSAMAQETNYPTKPVHIVVPFPPGGTVDTVTRLISNRLGEEIGQPIVIENKGGASGTIGARHVSQAKSDGYTILLTASNQVINPLILRNVPYDPDKDFTPICYIGYVPQLVLVKSDFPANTFQEFMDLASAQPGKLTWATAGLGTAGHFAEELIKLSGNLDMEVIAYRGGGPALTDLVAGHVNAMVEPIPSGYPHVKSGSLKALAVTSAQRANALPDIPTVSESGLQDFELPSWYGIWGPPNVAPEIADKICASIKNTLADSDVAKKLDALSFVSVAEPAAKFSEFIQNETKKYQTIVDSTGLVID